MLYEENNFLFKIHHDHLDTEKLVVEILHKIAAEKNKSVLKIKNLLLIKQNKGINNRFWQILDSMNPGHGYNYVGCCPECGALELREQL
jgi:hypothetical protein